MGLRAVLALALALVAGVPAVARAQDGAPIVVVRSGCAEARASAGGFADAYAREVDLWARQAGQGGRPHRLLSDADLVDERTMYDALVLPFPDIDDPALVSRLMAMVEQARRVLLVGSSSRGGTGLVERLRVVCGAPVFTRLSEPRERHLVLAGRSFPAGEVTPATRFEVRAATPAFAASSPRGIGWYVRADLAPLEPEAGADEDVALAAFTCGGAEVVWSGVPFSGLAAPADAAARVVANLTAWLAGAPWLGRAPWRDDRTFAVVIEPDLRPPFDGVADLASMLAGARLKGSFVVPPALGLPPELLAAVTSAGEVSPTTSARVASAALAAGVRDDCTVLRDVGDHPGADVASTLLADLDRQARRGALYPLRLQPGCLAAPAHRSAVALFLAGARQRPAWFATHGELSAWEHVRRAVRVEPIPGGFRVQNAGDTPVEGFPLVAYRFGPLDLAAVAHRALVLPRDDGGFTLVLDLAPRESVDLAAEGR